MTAVAGCLLVALVVERARNTPGPAASGSGSMAQATSRATGQDRDEAPAKRDDSPAKPDDRDLPVVEPQRGLWPAVAESGTLTDGSPRMGDADGTVAQFADAWGVEPARRSAGAPGSFGPPVGLVRSRRPRSYVEHRRMLLEELECFHESSAEGSSRHQPTGV